MINYFEIFSLPTNFAIDLDDLEKQYLTFQKKFHPDNSSTADIEHSIEINDAYKILTNPIKRASHILQLNGVDIEDDSKTPKPDMATLMEIIELQEKVSEITADEISDLRKSLSLEIKSLLDSVSLKFENKDFTSAIQLLIRAKYFDKTLRDLKAKKAKF